VGGADQLELEVREGRVDAGGVGADLLSPAEQRPGAAVVVDGILGEEAGDPLGVARVPAAR
jgi:hypothetical protein